MLPSLSRRVRRSSHHDDRDHVDDLFFHRVDHDDVMMMLIVLIGVSFFLELLQDRSTKAFDPEALEALATW